MTPAEEWAQAKLTLHDWYLALPEQLPTDSAAECEWFTYPPRDKYTSLYLFTVYMESEPFGEWEYIRIDDGIEVWMYVPLPPFLSPMFHVEPTSHNPRYVKC